MKFPMRIIVFASAPIIWMLIVDAAYDCEVVAGVNQTPKWSLDCDRMWKIDGDYLKNLVDVTFTNHTILVKNCSVIPHTTYVYTLDSGFVWNMRHKWYQQYAPELNECRTNVNSTLEEFYECIAIVRKNMGEAVLKGVNDIAWELVRIRKQLQQNC